MTAVFEMSRLPLTAALLAALAVGLGLTASRMGHQDGVRLLSGPAPAGAPDALSSGAASPVAPAPAALPLPVVTLAWSAGTGVVLAGVVPDVAEQRALVHRARSLYGAGQVQDALRVGRVANPSWLDPDLLPDLRGTLRARAHLADGRLELDGAMAPQADAQAIRAQLARMAATGVQVVDRLSVVNP